MATWNSDNIILTKLGEQVLSKVQSGVGKLTVSRIVSGAGHVSPAQLYSQTQVTDIKQELTIVKCTTTESQSTISANLTNTGLEEAYDLYQIGIYATHPDFTDEVLYLIAQCDSPDHIPLPGDNPVTLSYDLVMAHSGTKEVIINVSEAGYVDTTTFTEFAEEINTALNGKASSTDLDEHKNDNTMHVTSKEKASWNGKAELTDIPTTLPANGGNADTLNGRSTVGSTSLIRYTDGNYDCNTTISTGVYRGTFTNYPSGLPDGQGILLVMNYHGANSEVSGTVGTDTTWLRQWFISPHGYSIYERLVVNTTVTAWTPINDGGNAVTLESHPASDFALKTDIPTTLPANGGKSDTTNHQINHHLPDGKDVLTYATSDDCPYNANTKVRIMNSPTCPTNYGYNAASNDFWYDIYKLDNLWVTIKAYDVRGNVEFINSCCNGTWYGWTRCNDGGNASSLGGYTVSGCDLMSNKNQNGGHVTVGTFNDSNGDWAFLDVAATTGNRTRVQMGSESARPRAYHYDADTNTWTETAYNMAAYASTDEPLTVSNFCLRNISAGTADLSAGVSKLATGAIYLVYE